MADFGDIKERFMCGIAGIVWKDVSRPGARADASRMCDVQRHRGPDAGSVYVQGPVALGHRRLSILDLSDVGTQPMVSHDNRFVIVFNGEIYNYIELREELSRLGSSFRTGTDTEVIIEAYRHWGDDCIVRFNGMWAFVLYDTRNEAIFVSRDRFGIKPFHYLLDDDSFVFASEIKAILAVRPAERIANASVLARFIPTGLFGDGEETFFANIRTLLPAHNASYDIRRGIWKTWRYWQVEPEKFAAARGTSDPIEMLTELLSSSVRLHMRSDVPVGTCLSGGIDSSAIVCLMSASRNSPVHTYSGIYSDEGYNEAEYVEEVTRRTNTVPCSINPEPNGDLLEDLRNITWHQDNPTAGPGLYTQYHVMRRASHDVKVILDGQGADELFGGYLHYFTPHLQDLLERGLGGRIAAMSLLASIWRHWGAGAVPSIFGGGVGRLLQRVLRWKLASVSLVPADQIVHPDLAKHRIDRPIASGVIPGVSGHLNRVMIDQLLNTSLPALLHYEDRNSMAFSLEARVPFLDYRIVEFALGLDTSYKISSSWTKWVLRKATQAILPPKITWRRSKLGYPTPMARWFRKPSERGDVEDVIFSNSLAARGLVRSDVLQNIWDRHQAGQDYSWILYRVLTTELWHRHFIDASVSVPVRLCA